MNWNLPNLPSQKFLGANWGSRGGIQLGWHELSSLLPHSLGLGQKFSIYLLKSLNSEVKMYGLQMFCYLQLVSNHQTPKWKDILLVCLLWLICFTHLIYKLSEKWRKGNSFTFQKLHVFLFKKEKTLDTTVIGNPRLTWGETYRYIFLAYIYNEK